MYIVEFNRDDNEMEDYHRVFVYDYKELLQLLNYINEFEYTLESVHKESMFVGYNAFRDYVKNYTKEGRNES